MATAPTLTERAAMPGGVQSRIPSLDGFRGIAISLVLASHLSGSLGWARPVATFLGPIGYLGVRIFLIITGLLVTHLLLREFEKKDRIDVLRFWARRAFRLLPAVLLFMGAVYAAASFGVIGLNWPRDYLFPLTFTMNYYPGRGWYWVHLWSLSAQIQFYLLWPLLMMAAGRARVLHLALAVIAVVPIIRLLTFNLLPIWYTQGHSLETILDMFATGALLAVLRRRMGESTTYLNFLQSSGMVGLVGLLLGVHYLTLYAKPRLVLGTVLNFALAILIDRSSRFSNDWWGKLLAARPLVFLGTISYSLYLWQQPFVNLGTPFRFPATLLLALLAGTLSYYLVEKPMTNLGRRVTAQAA